MIKAVGEAYDSNAELYAQLFLDELANDAQSTRWLTTLAAIASERRGQILDVGCGPGSAVSYLTQLGADVRGIDISFGQIAQARLAFPDLDFGVGDLTSLAVRDESLGGIVSRYSIIHLPPSGLDDVFADWFRVLEPGAPVLVEFFGSRSADSHGEPFDHKVATAYELFPAEVGRRLQAVGFAGVEIEATAIPEGGRPFNHTTVFARKSSS